ncbi:MAG: PilZ domain-containing protein [Gemmatales bacterium]|nr:PilZ domain-containing protein [Gemmatales bacterium]MDW8388388.1 PilZ domain-containing protein [Gemmatales bacterium]
MNPSQLQQAAEAVLRRAAELGSLLPQQIRSEVAHAGADPKLWKQVVALAGSHLVHRKGRYYYVSPTSPQRLTAEQRSQAIHQAVHELVAQYRKAAELQERREADRFTFIQPVVVESDDGQTYRMLTKDISASGLRLLGTRGLLGQRLRVRIPTPPDKETVFLVRILWTCMVGDDLYENGGSLVELLST